MFDKLTDKIVHTGSSEKKLELLAKLQRLLDAGSPLDEEKAEISLTLRDKLRERVAEQARVHYAANPGLYPSQFTLLLSELNELRGKSPGYTASADDTKKLRNIFEFSAISAAVTEENLKAYYDSAYKALAENPRQRKAGLNTLYVMTMLEVISAYMQVLLTSQVLPQPQTSNIYLLMTLEDMILLGFDIGFLYYNGSMYEILSPENLCIETDVEAMHRKLAVVRRALRTTSNDVYESFTTGLTDMFTPAFINALTTAIGGTDCLPAETRFRVDCLEEIECAILTAPIERSAPSGMTPRAGREAALEMLDKLCVHKDITYLRSDYEELLDCAAACPRCVEELQQQANLVLSEYIISELLSLSDKPSDAIRCLSMLQHTMTATLPDRVVVYF